MFDFTNTKPHVIDLPVVSVIVPCYNVEHYIDQCLTSILENGYDNLEVICVDDRSTDSTVEHIKKLKSKYRNIQLYHNYSDHQLYGGGCRNIGLEHATGKYVYFCDSDDYTLPGLFKYCVERCEKVNAEICCFKHAQFFTDTGKLCHPSKCFKKELFYDDVPIVFNYKTCENILTLTWTEVWDKLYLRKFLIDNNLSFEQWKNTEDVVFVSKTMALANRITFVDREFYVYRKNIKTSSQGTKLDGQSLGNVVDAFSVTFDFLTKLGDTKLIHNFNELFKGQLIYDLHEIVECKNKVEYAIGMKKLAIRCGIYGDYIQDVIEGYLSRKTIPSLIESNYDVIISLTSHPHRFTNNQFILCLSSLLYQKTKFKYKIVLTIFDGDMQYLSDQLDRFIRNNDIEIIRCGLDLKSHKKYFYSMQKYRDTPIITVDDDVIYSENLVENLYSTYLQNKNCVICGRCDRLQYDNDGSILPFSEQNKSIDKFGFKSKELFGVGVGGILYPTLMNHIMTTGILELISKIPMDDDILMYILARHLQLEYMTSNIIQGIPQKNLSLGMGFFGIYNSSYFNDSESLWKRRTNGYEQYLKYINDLSFHNLIGRVIKNVQSKTGNMCAC